MSKTIKKSVVAFKACPRCHGSGQVPCDGNEHIRKEQREWAYLHNMKPVSFQCWDGTVVAGLAVPQLLPGGYHNIKIYVKVTDPPNNFGHAYMVGSDGIADSLYKVGKVNLFMFDIINDKAFWPVTCRYMDRDNLQLLDSWPEWVSLDDINLLEMPSTVE